MRRRPRRRRRRPRFSRRRSSYTASTPVQWAPSKFASSMSRSFAAVQSSVAASASKRWKPPSAGVHMDRPHPLACIFQGVDDARMAAAGDQHQPLVRVEHQRHVLGDVILGQPSVRLSDRALEGPVALGVSPRDRSGQPGPREELRRTLDHDERPAEMLIFRPGAQRLVGLATIGGGTTEEDPRSDMGSLEGRRVPPGQLATQRHQASGMVAVMVAEDHVGHAGEVGLELEGVPEHGLGARPGVEEDAMAFRFDQRREAPLAHAGAIGQHR